jgi:uroporphyrinogen-III synthase
VARILVTRPEPGASETARKLQALGFEPITMPLTEIRPLPVYAYMIPAAFDAVAVTSASAVRHASPELMARLAKRQCFAVGGRTAQAARDAGFSDVVVADGGAGSLVHVVTDALPRQARLAYLCGRVRRPEFEAMLAASGVTVVPVEVYDTVDLTPPSDVALRLIGAGEVDAALAYSATGARALAKLIAQPGFADAFRNTRLLCLSPRIAQALGAVSRDKIFVSPEPCEEALIGMLGRS